MGAEAEAEAVEEELEEGTAVLRMEEAGCLVCDGWYFCALVEAEGAATEEEAADLTGSGCGVTAPEAEAAEVEGGSSSSIA